MDRATRSRIEAWDARPVSAGYAGLADLADADFTGAVVAGGTHLFMLNGRVVGVVDGSMSAFEGAESSAYEAPDPALPLLFAMRARGGDVRGKYYTDDTPLREVDETLRDGGFTGFLELSENVLSGDYYVVYYGGRSLAAAFVGNEERVVTGDEAFDLAADEVGIYEVRSVDLQIEDVPEPPEDAAAGPGGAAASGAAAGAGVAGTADDESPDVEATDDDLDEDGETADEETADGTTDDEAAADGTTDGEPTVEDTTEPGDASADEGPEPTIADDAEPAADAAESGDDAPGGPDDEVAIEEAEAGADPATDAVEEEPADDEPTAEATAPTAVEEAESGRSEEDGSRGQDGTATPSPAPGPSSASSRPEESTNPTASTGQDQPSGAGRQSGASEPDERFREEERWREARTVPALDPEETELPPARGVEATPEAAPPTDGVQDRTTDAAEDDGAELDALSERVRELESELEATERERQRQAERAEELTDERDDLLEEREALEERIEELEARIEEQEARLEAQEAEIAAQASAPADPDSPSTGGREAISESDALDQTDLFVRYRSKGRATLQTAHDGQADRDAVAENLRLETHSRFDPDGVSVNGLPFDSYLEDTIEYRFVAWLVEVLLYELQETGTERNLRALYDALPRIDRAEFGGTVTSVDEEGSERGETFDVICRDRMGKPLVVANINDSLDPASGEMMGDLVENGTAVAEAHESISAAFLVTASFFEPDALETAADATGGGFLSRDSKKSFVKLSRKGGYHLCLVEARGGDFHVAVPEL